MAWAQWRRNRPCKVIWVNYKGLTRKQQFVLFGKCSDRDRGLVKIVGKSLCAGAKEAHRRWGSWILLSLGSWSFVVWHPELWPVGFKSQCKILVIIDETSILNSRILAILLRGQRTNPSNIHGNVSLPQLRFATGKKSKGKNGKNGPRAQTVLRISSNIAM